LGPRLRWCGARLAPVAELCFEVTF
jgi:hypothetical protein